MRYYNSLLLKSPLTPPLAPDTNCKTKDGQKNKVLNILLDCY